MLRICVISDGVVGAASDRGGNAKGSEFWGYVDVRPGAHMFYWLYHSYHADGYLRRPLVVWLQVLMDVQDVPKKRIPSFIFGITLVI